MNSRHFLVSVSTAATPASFCSVHSCIVHRLRHVRRGHVTVPFV
jgi:hypothetical protein